MYSIFVKYAHLRCWWVKRMNLSHCSIRSFSTKAPRRTFVVFWLRSNVSGADAKKKLKRRKEVTFVTCDCFDPGLTCRRTNIPPTCVCVCMCMYVCAWVCERKEITFVTCYCFDLRWHVGAPISLPPVYVCVCVCMCVRECVREKKLHSLLVIALICVDM
jgi:hypothetical protein